MSKVLVLQHSPCEDLGVMEPALQSHGLVPCYVQTHLGEPAPTGLDETAALVVLGGPMGVYEGERYPFLAYEMRLIERAMVLELPVLGVCLGSQLIAAVLGAEVRRGATKEIGWYPVRLADASRAEPLWAGTPAEFCAFHWHGDIFDLPAGAVQLASSELTSCQSFRLGAACACLFHMEVTERIVHEMVDLFADELAQEQLDGRKILDQSARFLPTLSQVGGTFFRNWAQQVVESSTE